MISYHLAKKLYIGGGSLLGENVHKHLVNLKNNQWLKGDKLLDLQWIKFIKILNHAYLKSAYYNEKFNAYGIKPSDIKSSSDLYRIPILTKTDLRNNYTRLIVNNKNYKYTMAKSSGSTGQAVKFFKDRNASGHSRAAMYLGHSWYGLDIGHREAKLWGIPNNLASKVISRTGDYLLNRFREKNFQLDEETLNSFYQKIKKYKPHYLMGYTSMVYEFANYLQSMGIDASKFALKMVKVTAETVFDYQRALIEKVFASPVAVEYGAAEVGIVAFECPHKGLHIITEGVFVEEYNTQVHNLREFIITDLNNFYSPIIRYKIGDYGCFLNKTCSCGRELPLLKEVVGRTSDIVYKADGSPIHSSVFSYILKDITERNGGITQYKVYQKKKGYLEIHLVKGIKFNQNTINILLNSIKKYMGKDIIIKIVEVQKIGREPSGKLRYFVSEVK